MQDTQSYRPSKQFIIRGSIATSIIIIILVVQTNWFRGLFHKKPLPKLLDTNQTVGDIISKDTNGNGIADWEEKLWGLDPTVLYTNGVPNKQIIEEKKKALGITDKGSTPLNETDRLARELFVIATSFGNTEGVTNEMLQAMGDRMAASIKTYYPSVTYTINDLTIMQTTDASLRTYAASMRKMTNSFSASANDLDIIIQALDSEDPSGLSKLTELGNTYKTYAQTMLSIPVPIGVAKEHVTIINALAGVGDSFSYISKLGDDSIVSLAGLALYRTYMIQVSTAATTIGEYLQKYGILE